ncbi:unnamed protein product [Adineta ricciae]|uniref:Uncharacterized protein n=1 Tax=Adineta ricciae TaxID=249248 RepID=A0A815RZE4_ADIRI|nr:unnamed protein product [Adineta ricciae]CAF1484758.1 unnamed protein product [Adineta ricciae]
MHYSDQRSILPVIIQNPLLPTRYSSFHQINYEIHSGFTLDEETFIQKALAIIDNRLLDEKILQNMYQICGTSGCLFAPGVWSRSKLAKNKEYSGIHDLLRFQLMCLKLEIEENRFPVIHLYPTYEKSDTQAEGKLGCISCISHGSKFSIEGAFHIKLNQHNLDTTNEQIGNSIYWAGTIVHEMLHNLGHKHQINDYTDQWQINVFEKCFLYNGNYVS